MKYAQEAHAFRGALEKLAGNPDAMDNFESYLSYHFEAWLERYVKSDPENLIDEIERFARV